MATRADALIIGTGQAGPSLAHRFAGAGMQVVVFERKRFGGTCVNTGCIPTKTLVASAKAAWFARHAADYGVVVDNPVHVDMKKVRARKDDVAGQSERGVRDGLKQLKNCRVVEGHARFVASHQVEQGGEVFEAPRIFLNVGARATIPAIPGLDQISYLTNTGMVDLDVLPERLLILGGSYVGLEFGQMYRRFGSEVTIIERSPNILSREDADISAGVCEVLEKEGIRVITGAHVIAVKQAGGEITVSWQGGEAQGSDLLLAVGRVPNTDDLGLEAAGIRKDKRGYIQVNDELETNVPGVWALGDCNGKGAFTHTSYNDYEIVAANLLDGASRRLSDRITAYNVYVDPPVARIGMSEKEVRASGLKALIATRPMTRVGRAVEKGETAGFLKVMVDAETRRILGACLLGVECDEVVHCLLDVMYAKAPCDVILRAVHIHPTVSELIPTLLGDLKPL